jgi:L-asparaginase II
MMLLTGTYLTRNDMPPRKIYHNCAGKHIALMMLSGELGEDHRSYWKMESAAQQEVLGLFSYLSGCPREKVGLGIDGCGVPVFAVPFAGNSDSIYESGMSGCYSGYTGISEAAKFLTELINENPYMMRGHGFPCGEFNLDRNVVAKGGAKGVYGFGLKRERLGIALKLEDGTEDTWPMIIQRY